MIQRDVLRRRTRTYPKSTQFASANSPAAGEPKKGFSGHPPSPKQRREGSSSLRSRARILGSDAPPYSEAWKLSSLHGEMQSCRCPRTASVSEGKTPEVTRLLVAPELPPPGMVMTSLITAAGSLFHSSFGNLVLSACSARPVRRSSGESKSASRRVRSLRVCLPGSLCPTALLLLR